MLKFRLAQIPGKTRGSPGAAPGSAQAKEQACACRKDHPCTDLHDMAHITGINAMVNDRGHQKGNDHLHDDLAHHEGRSKDRRNLKLPYMSENRCVKIAFLSV